MKILRDAGKYTILTLDLQEQLRCIDHAARVCYRSPQGTSELGQSIRKIIRLGHESVIEHSILTVEFWNVSRGFTHELVRHRLASYSQESTRRVDQKELKFVLPPHRLEDVAITGLAYPMKPSDLFAIVESCYRALRDAGWSLEDARQILPIGTATTIVATANWREWRHILKLRAAKDSHWEIRSVMTKLLEELKETLPAVFGDI